jgi:hypothetical protein
VVVPPPPPVVFPLVPPPVPPPLGDPVVDPGVTVPVVELGVTEPVVDPDVLVGRGVRFRAGRVATDRTVGTEGTARLTWSGATWLSDGFEDLVARPIAKVTPKVAASRMPTSASNRPVVNWGNVTASRIRAGDTGCCRPSARCRGARSSAGGTCRSCRARLP